NFAAGTDGKLAFANRARPFKLGSVIPNGCELLSPQIPSCLGQLHARKYVSVRRNVAAVVARAARQIFVCGAFDSAGNRAPERYRQRFHGTSRLRSRLRL